MDDAMAIDAGRYGTYGTVAVDRERGSEIHVEVQRGRKRRCPRCSKKAAMERRRAGGSGQGRSCPLVAAGARRRAAASGLRGCTATGCHGGASREQPLGHRPSLTLDSSLSTIFGSGEVSKVILIVQTQIFLPGRQ